MKIIVTDNYEASCLCAAGIIAELVRTKPNAKLGLATGGTPVPIYKKLAEDCAAGTLSFAQVHTVNLDEYCGLPVTNDQSYRYFMDHNLFDHIDIDKANTYVASGLGDLAENCHALDAKVLEDGVTDLQLLGIGNNGHIAFNEAADTLHADTHIEQLTPVTIAANARFFATKDDVPTQAITMGMRSILAAKAVLLVASGEAKTEAIRGLIMDDVITTHNPSTLLKLHADATVIIDKALATAVGYKGE
ncbi:MAG: glucosamine-6-phosphate deaminase [Pygmaiobacter sp.]